MSLGRTIGLRRWRRTRLGFLGSWQEPLPFETPAEVIAGLTNLEREQLACGESLGAETDIREGGEGRDPRARPGEFPRSGRYLAFLDGGRDQAEQPVGLVRIRVRAPESLKLSDAGSVVLVRRLSAVLCQRPSIESQPEALTERRLGGRRGRWWRRGRPAGRVRRVPAGLRGA